MSGSSPHDSYHHPSRLVQPTSFPAQSWPNLPPLPSSIYWWSPSDGVRIGPVSGIAWVPGCPSGLTELVLSLVTHPLPSSSSISADLKCPVFSDSETPPSPSLFFIFIFSKKFFSKTDKNKISYPIGTFPGPTSHCPDRYNGRRSDSYLFPSVCEVIDRNISPFVVVSESGPVIMVVVTVHRPESFRRHFLTLSDVFHRCLCSVLFKFKRSKLVNEDRVYPSRHPFRSELP